MKQAGKTKKCNPAAGGRQQAAGGRRSAVSARAMLAHPRQAEAKRGAGSRQAARYGRNQQAERTQNPPTNGNGRTKWHGGSGRKQQTASALCATVSRQAERQADPGGKRNPQERTKTQKPAEAR